MRFTKHGTWEHGYGITEIQKRIYIWFCEPKKQQQQKRSNYDIPQHYSTTKIYKTLNGKNCLSFERNEQHYMFHRLLLSQNNILCRV